MHHQWHNEVYMYMYNEAREQNFLLFTFCCIIATHYIKFMLVRQQNSFRLLPIQRQAFSTSTNSGLIKTLQFMICFTYKMCSLVHDRKNIHVQSVMCLITQLQYIHIDFHNYCARCIPHYRVNPECIYPHSSHIIN